MTFYCYVYYDETWQAVYVGKGCGNRFYHPNHILVPPKEQIQIFHFDHEWQAWECEIELIAFWKRQCDGGTLLNKALGGPGPTGVIYSQETNHQKSIAQKGQNNSFFGKKHTTETKRKMSAALKGKNNPNYGKKLSDEQKAKISIARKAWWKNKNNGIG